MTFMQAYKIARKLHTELAFKAGFESSKGNATLVNIKADSEALTKAILKQENKQTKLN